MQELPFVLICLP